MNLEEQIRNCKKEMLVTPEEKHIQETIKKSIDTFYAGEQEKRLNDWEFLWLQLGLVRKKWWLFQFILLLLLWTALPKLQALQHIQRSMGVAATLFVILIIPELWKSRTCGFMEIEAASYYSLRQIYAARMMLFGMVDVLLITVFCGISSITMNITLSELLVQFVFPMVVTACICFGILCSKYPFGETAAVIMCLAWSAVWLTVMLNDKVYAFLTLPLWIALLGMALIFLAVTIFRILHDCNHYWEVNISGIETY